MPTYDYRCSACGHALEVFQSISEPRKRKCPRCKKPKLERLIGQGAGILFKGGGFYQTDYRSDSYKKSESAEKSGAQPKGETSDSKSDASAPKSESSASKSDASSASGSTEKPAEKSVEKPAPKSHAKSAKHDKRGKSGT
jgi:putative FmdB family regulatory protein